MVLHLSSLNTRATIILALNFKLSTIISYVLVHIIKWQHQPTFQNAINNPKWALTRFMIIYIFPKNFTTHLTVGAADRCVFTLSQMFVNISYF